jgi:hypothetical protein
MTTALEKTEWSKFTVRIPKPWALRIQEVRAISGTSEAQIMRELVQIGLPIIARQTEERMEWVRGRISPKGSGDGQGADGRGSGHERKGNPAGTTSPSAVSSAGKNEARGRRR